MIDYYMKTHCRFGVYVIGMICGYYIYQIKKEKKSINLQNVSGSFHHLMLII